MLCEKCGNRMPDEDTFCIHCGARKRLGTHSDEPVYAQPIGNSHPKEYNQGPVNRTPAPNARLRSGAKRQTVGIVAIIASGLAFIMLFLFVIGPFISGKTIFGDKAALVAGTGSAMVSPEDPVAEINGVTVDFGYNLTEEAKLTIKTSVQSPDSEDCTGMDVYGFTLEGQDEFVSLVDITLPNTAAEDEDFYVAYHNKQTGEWEQVPFETEKNMIQFSTKHFSEFAVIKFHKYRNDQYRGPRTPAAIHFGHLNEALKELDTNFAFDKFLKEKGTGGSDEFTNAALSALNNIASTASSADSIMNFLKGTNTPEALELSNRLTAVGGTLTLLKVAYQWQAGDAPKKIIEDNIFNLSQLALSSAAIVIPASTVLPLAAVGVFALGMIYEYGIVPANTDDSLKFTLEAYRIYCTDVTTIQYDEVAAKELAEGKSGTSPWKVVTKYNPDTRKWEEVPQIRKVFWNGFDYKWKKALTDVYELYQKDPQKMLERIRSLIDEYIDLFWSLPSEEMLQYVKDKTNVSEKDFRWPMGSEETELKQIMKAELLRDLEPVFKDVQDEIIKELRGTLIDDAYKMTELLNTRIDFVIHEPEAGKDGRKASTYEEIKFGPISNEAHAKDWVCDKGNYASGDVVFVCTLFNYLNEGMPNKAYFYEKKGDAPKEVDFVLSIPTTTITVTGEREDKIYQIGETARTDTFEITVTDVQKAKDWIISPDKGYEYVFVYFRIKNVSKKKQSISQNRFQYVKDGKSKGAPERSTTGIKTSSGAEADWPFEDIAPGDSVEASAVYAIPTSMSRVTLIYHESLTAGSPQLKFGFNK
jgi:hypothetical protein